ncbi:unnamed protein product [Prorocentrum cordatum]|uniref:Uncharacterized protein n=1 Tax=Prorocentrum cordatum TaxID=2364126 RepID=A0ABN9P6D6_9DINO|nr:unnamed protein product [Polarella glacialis]
MVRGGSSAAARAGAMDVDGAGEPEESQLGLLLAACGQGDAEAVRCLLQGPGGAASTVVNRPGPGGETPLLAACRAGNQEAVSALLAAGADPGAADDEGLGCALLAATSGSVELLRWLLEQDLRVGGHMRFLRWEVG